MLWGAYARILLGRVKGSFPLNTQGRCKKTPHTSLGKLKSFTLIPVLKKYEKKKYENKKEIENGSLLKKEERKDD